MTFYDVFILSLIHQKHPGTIYNKNCKEFLHCFNMKQIRPLAFLSLKQFPGLSKYSKFSSNFTRFFAVSLSPLLVYYIELIHPGTN